MGKEKISKETMELIPIGVCMSCRSLLYLGMTNCSKCGAPVGDSIDLEALQDRVDALLAPETEVVYQQAPNYGIANRGATSTYGTTAVYGSTTAPMMYFTSSDEASTSINFRISDSG